MLDVKRLRILKAVAEEGSFSAAAEALSYTQSAISQQIAALEREAGTTLVDRSARGIRLTDAGRALVVHSDAILARLSAAEAELEAIAGLRGGRLRLAAFQTAGATLVPLAVARFSKQHPGVELSFTEFEPEDAFPRLKAGEIDIALTFDYSTLPSGFERNGHAGELERIHLLDDPMYVVLAEDHPLAGKKSLKLQDFAGEAWVQGCPATSCGVMHLRACQAAGFDPRVAFESDDYNIVQGLVAAGVAVSLLPDLALTNLRNDVVIRDLGRQAPVRQVYAATLAGGFRSPAVDAMLGILTDAAEDYVSSRRAIAA
jgi:DNA-binding transcriptional LysR family regulator